jgi:hypothetical protein
MRPVMQHVDQQHQMSTGAKAPGLVAEFVDFGRAMRSLLDPYRPERHYMRGPGPKWRAKHSPVRVIEGICGAALQESQSRA